MPLQNRVTPAGDLVADPARGLLMGNRGGRFHDPATRTLATRRYVSRAWIICLTAFRDRPARTVWGRGYTELFFLDEVTALAGHRPCAECRRAAARAFQGALARAAGEVLRLPAIDRLLDGERREGRAKRVHAVPAESLPDGAVILAGDGLPHAVRDGALRVWSFAGYGPARPLPTGPVACLTPPLSLAALRGGYAPVWHPTAT